jgi:outer membrane cobalamin receptor
MRRVFASIAFFTLTATLAGHAQNVAVDSAKVHSIAEVSVVANRRIARDVIPAQELSGEELRRLSAVSVADAIRYFSGVQIKDYGGVGGLKTVNIRSMGTQHVGVFYDGVQLGNAMNGQIDLGRFSMDNMEAISVYNGQKSDILQSARDFASAGAIYMTSRRPLFGDGRRHNLRLALKGGSFGTVNPSALWEMRAAKNLDIQLSAEYLYSTGRYKFHETTKGGYDTVQVRQNGDVRALRAEGGLFGRLPRGDWRAKIYLYDSERGYPGASVAHDPGRFRHIARQWDTDLFAQGSLRQTLGWYTLSANVKIDHNRLHYRANPEGRDPEMYVDNRFRQREFYLSAAHEFTLREWWRASLATDMQYNTLDANLLDFVRPTRTTVLAAGATAVEFERFKAQASLLYTRVHDETRTGGGAAGDRNRWTPTAVASYRPLREVDLTFRAFYKNIFRMPTLNDLYYTVIGNVNLDPERTAHYNLGAVYVGNFARGPLRRLEVQADVYYNEVHDKIIAVPSGGGSLYRWTMINLGYVEIRGLNTSLQGDGRFGAFDWRLRLAYTLEKAQDLTPRRPADMEYYGDYIPYAPLHSGSAVAGLAWRRWSLDYSFIYTGERWDSSANDPDSYIKPWYTSDLALSHTLPLRRSGVRLTAEVNNIFDQQYDVVLNYPMPGTNVMFKISWTL